MESKMGLEEIRKIRSNIQYMDEQFDVERKYFFRSIGTAVVCSSITISMCVGLLNSHTNDGVTREITNVYPTEIERTVTEENNNSTRYIVYTPWVYNEYDEVYERSVREFEYEPLSGETTVENIEENLSFVDSYKEEKNELSDTDSLTEPVILIERNTDQRKQTVQGTIAYTCVLGSLAGSMMAIAVMGDEDFYRYWNERKGLKKREKLLLQKIKLQSQKKEEHGKILKKDIA